MPIVERLKLLPVFFCACKGIFFPGRGGNAATRGQVPKIIMGEKASLNEYREGRWTIGARRFPPLAGGGQGVGGRGPTLHEGIRAKRGRGGVRGVAAGRRHPFNPPPPHRNGDRRENGLDRNCTHSIPATGGGGRGSQLASVLGRRDIFRSRTGRCLKLTAPIHPPPCSDDGYWTHLTPTPTSCPPQAFRKCLIRSVLKALPSTRGGVRPLPPPPLPLLPFLHPFNPPPLLPATVTGRRVDPSRHQASL